MVGSPSLFTGCWGIPCGREFLLIIHETNIKSAAAKLFIQCYQMPAETSSNERRICSSKKGFLTPSSHFNGKWYFYCLNNNGEIPLEVSTGCMLSLTRLFNCFDLQFSLTMWHSVPIVCLLWYLPRSTREDQWNKWQSPNIFMSFPILLKVIISCNITHSRVQCKHSKEHYIIYVTHYLYPLWDRHLSDKG